MEILSASIYDMCFGNHSNSLVFYQFLLRGLPHVLQYSPEPMLVRSRLPDPSHEPNFAEISRLYPLPEDYQRPVVEARLRLQTRGFLIFDHVFDEVCRKRRAAAA